MTGATDAATKITVLKHFVEGRDKAFIAAATGMSQDAVMSVATKHGYPRPESMERAIGILETEIEKGSDLTSHEPVRLPASGQVKPIPSTTANPSPVQRVDDTKTLIAAAKGHPSKVVQRQADRVLDALDKLRALIREDEERHAEKRKAAEEKAAAKAEVERLKRQLAAAKAKLRPVPNGNSDAARIRDWAREHNIDVPKTGRVPREVRDQYETAHAS